MQVNPYLFFNGNCEEALKYYQKVLGARIEVAPSNDQRDPLAREL